MISRLLTGALFLGIGLCSWVAQAEHQIFVCHTPPSRYPSATLSISDHGMIQWNSSEFQCSLAIRTFNILDRAPTPNIQMSLNWKNCIEKKKNPLFQKNRLNVLYLEILLKNPSTASLQWVRDEQPVECKIQNLDLSEIKRGSQKWENKNWGNF